MRETKRQKQLIETFLKIWRMKNTKIRFLKIKKNKCNMKRMQSKSRQENMKLMKFLYHVLMVNDICLKMELKVYHMVIKILFNYFN